MRSDRKWEKRREFLRFRLKKDGFDTFLHVWTYPKPMSTSETNPRQWSGSERTGPRLLSDELQERMKKVGPPTFGSTRKPITTEIVLELRAAGYSWRQIAEAFDVSKKTVQRRAKEERARG